MEWPARSRVWIFLFVTASCCAAQIASPSAPARDDSLTATSLSASIGPESYCRSLLGSGREADALAAACLFSLSLSQNMPNFVCEMEVEKYEDITRTYRSTQYMQKIHAHARYVNGKDSYDGLEINGRAVSGTNALIEGTWSFGEFGAKLLAAFNPKNHPRFKFARDTKVNQIPAYEYDFNVDHHNNRFWRWLWERKSALPGYEGKVWVSRRDGTILRLRFNSTQGVPDDFPIQSVESKTDYSYFDFKDRSGFVLPSKANIQTRMLDKRVYRTNIAFSHCKRFTVESHVVTENPHQ